MIPQTRPRILVIAYAFAAGRGSEPGAGWNWARMLAADADVCVLVSGGDRPQSFPELSGRQVRVVAVEGGRRPRTGWGHRIRYLRWQFRALRVARRLAQGERFDLVWHVTFANAWLGSIGGLIGPKFVFGPAGGGVGPPWRLAARLGVRALGYEVARSTARLLGRYVNPLARSAWRRAALILVQNEETKRWLPRRYREKVRPIQKPVIDPFPEPVQERSGRGASDPTAVFVGRLVPWKGLDLAVRAIAVTPDWRLVVCGSGGDRPRIERLIRRLGLVDRVELRGWQTRPEVARALQDADVLLFPSLHDDGGSSVLEGLARGCPVICLDRGGPQMIAGQAATVVASGGSRRRVVRRLGRALEERRFASRDAARTQALRYSLEARLPVVRQVLQEMVAAPVAGGGDPR